MNRRGATGVSLLLGLGAGLSVGVAIDVVLFLQGGQVPDLIGSLGLPGAILALVGAFFLGAKAYMTLKSTGVNGGHGGLRSAYEIRDAIIDEISKTRHDARSAIATASAEQTLNHRQLLEKLDAIHQALRDR